MKEAAGIKGAQAKSKGAVVLRKCLDNLINTCQNILGATPSTPRLSMVGSSSSNDDNNGTFSPTPARSGFSAALSLKSQTQSTAVLKQKIRQLGHETKQLKKDLIQSNTATAYNNSNSGKDQQSSEKDDQKLLQEMVEVINNPTTTTNSTSATTNESILTNESPSVLLQRARVAERKLELLMQHLANSVATSTDTNSNTTTSNIGIASPVISATNATTTTTATTDGKKVKALPPGVTPLNLTLNQFTEAPRIATTNTNNNGIAAVAIANTNTTNTAALNMELRKYQRKVKELEDKLVKSQNDMKQLQVANTKTNENGSSNTNNGVVGGVDPKAMAQLEKAHAKKVKELETIARKEKSNLEARAVKAEEELLVVKTQLPIVTQERDSLLKQIQDYKQQLTELDSLKLVAGKWIHLYHYYYHYFNEIIQFTSIFY